MMLSTWLRVSALVLYPHISCCAPNCQNLVISVTASANNVILPSNLTISDLTVAFLDTVAGLPTTVVAGTYSISAVFCKPENVVSSRHNTLQILSHGGTYTKEYWNGLGLPAEGTMNSSEYSWIDYASQQGYPTLAYDRICNGESQQLDGVLGCQLPLNAAILHQITLKAQSGAFGGRSFSSIILVGHSVGSLVQNYLAQTVPEAADILIQTGFSAYFARALPSALIAGVFLPAEIEDPSLHETDPSYLVLSSQQAATAFFYYGDFSQALATYDFVHRGAVSVGELATLLLGQITAPSFMGNVFVIDGQEDAVFCAKDVLAPVVGSIAGNCGTGGQSFTAQSAFLFPHAQSYTWKLVPDTGHCLNLHEDAQQTYATVHKYLEAQGY